MNERRKQCDEQTLERINEQMYQKLRISDIMKTEIEIKEVKHPFSRLFMIHDILGVGAFGIVLEITNLKTGEVNALKVLLKEDSKQMLKLNDETVEEQVLMDLHHENIIYFKQVLCSIDHVFIEMERCNGGTLESFINRSSKLMKLGTN